MDSVRIPRHQSSLSEMWKRTRSLKITNRHESTSSSASNSSSDLTTSSKPTLVATGGSVKIMTKASANKSSDSTKPKVVQAIFKYKARDKGELGFRKGDKLVVLDDYAPGWWIAAKNGTDKRGYIPINYVSSILESKEWYFANTSKKTAEQLLMDGYNARGCYLIRKSDQEPDHYMLSIRDLDQVKHYPIRVNAQNGDFFLNPDKTFARLEDLVEHYSKLESPDANLERLAQPCPVKPAIANQPELILPESVEVKLKKLDLVKELIWLSNENCKVYSGLFRGKRDQQRVGVKSLEPGAMGVGAFFHEAQIMHNLSHENLLRLVGVCTVKRPLIVVEYAANGDLLTYLRDSKEADSLKKKDLIKMAAQIASGLAYLESAKIVHRNLMARNCLLTEQRVVKIANFSQARVLEGGDFYIAPPQYRDQFAVKWTAPEALQHGIFSAQSDIWSFGIVLYEVMTKGMVPYAGMDGEQVLALIDHGERLWKPSFPPFLDEIYKVMRECWDSEPAKRPKLNVLHCYLDTFQMPEEPEVENEYELEPMDDNSK